ncbi:T9SS sorting signal type C domain-containing protein [Flavobacterium sp. DGU38]|uniref:T9SS sorting signal type C domain-containing protein n=1 Tax=Flavobacterium calami TaxID=3139144 RepID=A0ABU9IU84_9FLAO
MKKILLILLVGLFQNFIFGATITSTGTGGNWNSGSSWVGGVVPTAYDDVVIVNGATVTVVANSFVNNVTVQSGGTLTILNNIVFTVYGSVNVNSGGQFNGGTGNSDSAIIKVYGNFTNQGTANFWKSIVVIKGNLSTTSTILQNNGDIIVGGNVTATISGGGNGYVYPVNPGATVSVTGTSNAQPAGTKPTDPTLVALMNEVIYGANCPTSAGTLSGNQYICAYNSKTTTFSSTVSGGTWSSSNTAVATVNASTGLITSVDNSSGTVTITYTVGGLGGCTQYTATRTVYVANGQAASLGQISYNGTPYPNSPSPPLVLCKGSTSLTFSITGIPNVSGYVWRGDSSWIITPSADGLSAVVTFPANANQNNIEVYAKNGCTDFGRQSYIYITLSGPSNTAPTIISQPSTANQTTCLNGTASALSVTASGSSSYTYQWYRNTTASNSGGTLIAGATSQSYTPSTTTAGTFYYYCVVGGACSPTVTSAVSGRIIVNAVPTATAGGPDNVCQSASPTAITLTGASVGGSATTGAWSISGGAGGTLSSTLQTTTPGTVTYTPAANYTGTVTLVLTSNAGTGCSAVTSNRIINVNQRPTLTITNPAAVCSPSTVDLTAAAITAGSTAGLNYTYWTDPAATTAYGTPTAATAGTYYIKGTNASGCFAISAVMVTVNPNLPASVSIAASPTGAICSGTSVTFTATPTNPGTTPVYQWKVNGTNAGTNSSTFTTTTLANNDVVTVEMISNASPCLTGSPATSNAVVVTVSVVPSTPTIGTITNISCTTSTGSVALSGLPSGNWTITTTPATVSTSGSGSNTIISGLGAGNYTFTVRNASGCPSSATALVTISDNSSTTWNGSGWSNGLPDATKNVIIASTPYTFPAGFTACALTINTGVVATVPSGVTLTVTNAVTTNGRLIFENNASLVQINDIANVGAISYKRISQPMKNFDFTYWSSPVAGQTFVALSPNTLYDKYMSFTGTGWKSESPSSTMARGIGYIIRVPKPNSIYPNNQDNWTGSSYAQPVEFIGVPNNGSFTSSQTMVAGNFYLVGNPYPSALDANKLLYDGGNNESVLEGTIYFWTHNTAIAQSGSQYIYVSDDYATYNKTGGTATTYSPGNNTAPDGNIAAGQSFFATAKSAGNVMFNNSMRVDGNNNKFFKSTRTSKSEVLERHRVWLKMVNSGGAYKQTLIGYVEGATNNFDKNYDGLSFDGNSYIDLYSVNGSENYVIQGRALPFTDSDVVPLGYRSTIAGDFTIAIDYADGNLASQRIYLEDKQTGVITELTAGNYTFNTKAGTFNNRFVLRYTNKTLGTGDFEVAEDAVSVLVQNKTVTIDSSTENIDKVFIYDITGKQLYTKEKVNNLQLAMQNLPFAQQVLLVKIFLENGTVTTKKVIFK